MPISTTRRSRSADGGDEPALARPGGGRPRPARSRGDRARARRGLAGSGECRRAARRPGLARLPERGGSAGWPGWRDWLGALARARAQLHGPQTTLWIAAERLAQFQALARGAARARDRRPAASDGRDCSADDALVEILRGRLEGLGPVTESALAAPLGLEPNDIAAALAALQTEGFAMRGRFTPAPPKTNGASAGCSPGFTTIRPRLRAEIEPVAARDFLRFLLRWQRVAADARMQGPDAVEVIVAQLEGFEAPAGAWETEILPARIAEYEPSWLDDQCLAGRIAWARLRPRNGRAERQRAQPRARAHHADHAARAPSCPALDVTVAGARREPSERAGANGRRVHPGAGRVVLRRAGRRQRPAALPGRGGARRAGRARSRDLGQLGLRALLVPSDRRPGGAAPPPRPVRHGGRGPLGAGASRPVAAGRAAGPTRGGGARRAPVAAALRRGVLAPARARGRLAAAVARPAARLPPARGAARSAAAASSPASRASSSRCRMRSARDVRGKPAAEAWFLCPAPTRSTSSAS